MTAGWFLVFVWLLGFSPAPQGFSDPMASRFPPTPRFSMAPSWSLLDHGFSVSDSWVELVGSWEGSGGSSVAPLAPAALACLTLPPSAHFELTLKFLFLFWLGFFWLFWVVSRELNQNFRPRTLQSELPPIWRWSQILWHWLQQKTVLNGRLWGLGPARIRLAWEGFRRVFARTGEILRVNRDPGVHRTSRQNEPITSAAGGHHPATRDWPGHDAQWNPDDGPAIASRGRGGAGGSRGRVEVFCSGNESAFDQSSSSIYLGSSPRLVGSPALISESCVSSGSVKRQTLETSSSQQNLDAGSEVTVRSFAIRMVPWVSTLK